MILYDRSIVGENVAYSQRCFPPSKIPPETMTGTSMGAKRWRHAKSSTLTNRRHLWAHFPRPRSSGRVFTVINFMSVGTSYPRNELSDNRVPGVVHKLCDESCFLMLPRRSDHSHSSAMICFPELRGWPQGTTSTSIRQKPSEFSGPIHSIVGYFTWSEW